MRLINHKAQAAQLPVDKLRPFEGHPFRVKDDSEMEQLVYSILTQGLLTPISVRPVENNEYEVISGHRRLHACKKAGIEMVPALIYSLDRDAATIAMVDSSLHREKIMPSEKAFAYKLKMEAMSRQGQRTDLTLLQVATKLDTAAEIGKSIGDSRDKVYRYIRLTELIPEILTMVDDDDQDFIFLQDDALGIFSFWNECPQTIFHLWVLISKRAGIPKGRQFLWLGVSNRGESALLAGESKGDSVSLAVVSKGGGAALAGGIQWRAAPSVAGSIQ